MYDIIIIGGGPAGLTAGIYSLRANLKVLILEANAIGGQIASSPKVENYPGLKSVSGVELANSFYDQYVSLGGELNYEEVKSFETGEIKKVITDENTYKTKAIIIATGAHHRKLNIDREDELVGISYCATCDGAFYKDLTVAVVGGANSAVTSALYLSNIAKKVYILYRGSELRAEKALCEKVLAKENIEIKYNSVVGKLIGEDNLEAIQVTCNGNTETIDLDGLFISIGMDANNELFKDKIKLTEKGYAESNDTETSLEGIFVAGDVRNKSFRQLTTATNDGTIAAIKSIDYVNNLK